MQSAHSRIIASRVTASKGHRLEATASRPQLRGPQPLSDTRRLESVADLFMGRRRTKARDGASCVECL